MRQDFERIHRQRFGFLPAGRGLVVESLTVEAVGATETTADAAFPLVGLPALPVESVAVWQGGEWRDTPLFLRTALLPGQRLQGPAIIVEDTGTVVVEEGWQAEVNSPRTSDPQAL